MKFLTLGAEKRDFEKREVIMRGGLLIYRQNLNFIFI